jgi:hypothetical protein
MSVTGGGLPEYQGAGAPASSANLGDILERVLDKGLVVAGDIRVNLLDIELLTVKLRLVVASLETAREVGIDWWEHDPWLRGRDDDQQSTRELEAENRRLRRRLAALEADGAPELESGSGSSEEEPEQESREKSSADKRQQRRKEKQPEEAGDD